MIERETTSYRIGDAGVSRDRTLKDHPGTHSARTGEVVKTLESLLEQSRIIPAVRAPEFLSKATAASSKIVYLLCGTPENIAKWLGR